MRLSESAIRRIIREELLEAIIRRRGGEEMRLKTPEEMTPDDFHPVRNISDIKISPRRLLTLTDTNNPWIPGPVWDRIYNQGVSEEPVMFKVKKSSGEDAIIRTIKDYRVKEGTKFIIPQLFALARNPQTIDQAFGVGTVVTEPDIFETGIPGKRAPLALVEFDDSQKPDGALNRHPYVGIAFLKQLSYDEAQEMASTFKFLKARFSQRKPAIDDDDEET